MNPYFPGAIMPETVPFQELLYGLARSVGMSPEEEGLSRTIANQMTEAINTAYKICWQFHDWPDVCPTLPVPTETEPNGAGLRLIRKKTDTVWIGELLDLTTEAGAPVNFCAAPGCYVVGAADSTLCARFRPSAPKFTAVPWCATTRYQPGALVWDDVETGHVFQCRYPTQSLLMEPNWFPVPVLDCLVEATKAGARALYLQTEAQFSAATIVESAVLSLLEHEIQLVRNQQSQLRTHLS